MERLYVAVLQSNLHIVIEVQEGFVCVDDLGVLVDHPCDLPSGGNVFFLCSFFLNEDPSFEVSVDDLLETTRYLRITSKFVCNFAAVIVSDVIRSAMDFADSILLILTIASIGRLAHENTSLLIFIRQILKFLKSSQVSASFSGKLCLSSLVLPGYLQDIQYCKNMDKQAVTRCPRRSRLHSVNQGGVISTHCSTTSGSSYRRMFFQLHALQLSREVTFISRIVCGLKKMHKIIAANLQLGNFLTCATFERFVDFLIQSELLLPVK